MELNWSQTRIEPEANQKQTKLRESKWSAADMGRSGPELIRVNRS
jgi:hypothetical protein